MSEAAGRTWQEQDWWVRLFVPSLTYLPATGRAPTPTPLTPQNKRLVTPDTDTQSERTKTPTNGPVIMATIPAATLDGRQILHKSFCPGLGEESFSEEVGPRVGGSLMYPRCDLHPFFPTIPFRSPQVLALAEGPAQAVGDSETWCPGGK